MNCDIRFLRNRLQRASIREDGAVEFHQSSPEPNSRSPSYNSNYLKSQEAVEINIVDSTEPNDDLDMGPRDEIIARLRQLPEVLGVTDGEIAEVLGISSSAWANYKAERIGVTIRPMVALGLWNAFGIPMEWVYDGQTGLVADPVLRAKLSMANRRAEAWLASRRPSDRDRTPRIRTALLAGAFLFWVCGEAGQAWTRTDGASLDLARYNAARLACRGEARDHVEHQLAGDNEDDYSAIYIGCMSENGFTPNGNWYKP